MSTSGSPRISYCGYQIGLASTRSYCRDTARDRAPSGTESSRGHRFGSRSVWRHRYAAVAGPGGGPQSSRLWRPRCACWPAWRASPASPWRRKAFSARRTTCVSRSTRPLIPSDNGSRKTKFEPGVADHDGIAQLMAEAHAVFLHPACRRAPSRCGSPYGHAAGRPRPSGRPQYRRWQRVSRRSLTASTARTNDPALTLPRHWLRWSRTVLVSLAPAAEAAAPRPCAANWPCIVCSCRRWQHLLAPHSGLVSAVSHAVL